MESVNGVSVTRNSFRLLAVVPDDLVSLPAEAGDDWAAWVGAGCATEGGHSAPVLVSINVTALAERQGGAGRGLVAAIRARHRAADTVIEEFTTSEGYAAVAFRCRVTRRVRGRDVSTGQAQALVVYPGPGALGIVSGVCFHPDDLERAAVIVTSIAARMSVTGVTAAALPSRGRRPGWPGYR
jgi:hypothetical protein